MKYIVFIVLFLQTIFIQAQEEPETCNNLPYVNIDKTAILKSKLSDQVEKELPTSLEDGEHQATFKIYITCKGEVENQMYRDGNLSDGNQEWLMDIIEDTKWQAAVKDDVYVTSNVFLDLLIKDGKVNLTIR